MVSRVHAQDAGAEITENNKPDVTLAVEDTDHSIEDPAPAGINGEAPASGALTKLQAAISATAFKRSLIFPRATYVPLIPAVCREGESLADALQLHIILVLNPLSRMSIRGRASGTHSRTKRDEHVPNPSGAGAPSAVGSASTQGCRWMASATRSSPPWRARR